MHAISVLTFFYGVLGGEDALALKLDVMIDCCNDTCLKSMIDQSGVQRTGQCSRRNNRQSDSSLTFQSSCEVSLCTKYFILILLLEVHYSFTSEDHFKGQSCPFLC